MKPIVTGSLVALAAASLTANGLLYMRYSSNRPLVNVGNQVITKKEYQDALDYQTQGAVLKKLVLQDLVTQAAVRENVTPTEADVTARVAEIQRSAPQMLGAAATDPAKMDEFKANLKADMALDNVRAKDVRVTDAEVVEFYNRHKSNFALPAQVQTTMVVAQGSVDASEAATLLKQNIAADVIARQPRLHVVGVDGFNVNIQAMSPDIRQRLGGAVAHMKVGDVQTLQIDKEYVVIRANKSSQAGVPPLAQIKPEVTRLAAMEKAPAPAVELATLYQAAKPQFHVAKYEDYFSDLSGMDVHAADKKTASAQ